MGRCNNNYKGTLTFTNCKINDNGASHFGGAINNGGNINITNTSLNNNCASGIDNFGGVIYNEGNITITKSTLNNNHAYSGGAIYNYNGNITITKSKLNNNNASGMDYAHSGGAIYNTGGKINIINSTLNNNKAIFGGAISNHEGNITLTKSTLNNNIANGTDFDNISDRIDIGYVGGAIQNYLGTLNIINSTINNNKARHGGAINNKEGNITISKSTLNNNTANETVWINKGGAISNNMGSLKIFNSTLNNNKAHKGGAISNIEGTLTITNTTFNNNIVEEDCGGAISNIEGTLSITKTSFNNNKAEWNGGAINNYYGTLTITNTTFNNNKANNNGGAINNQRDGTIKLTNTILTQNNAKNIGGAISSFDGILNIIKSTLNNNKAENGGAIYYMYEFNGKLELNNCNLNNNTARLSGGAIYNVYNDPTIKDCVLRNNKAEEGGAITEKMGSVTINKNIFINNTSNMTGKAINCSGNGKISNNINSETSKCSGTIYVLDSDFIIKNNTFYDYEIKSTAITIEHTKTVTVGNEISIYGKLTDNNGNNLAYKPVKITVDGKTYKTNTTKYGNYNIKITPTSVGTKKIKVTYAGDKYNLACSNSTSFKVKQPTWIKMAYIGNVKYGSTVKLVGRLLNGSNAVKYVPVNITVNGKTYKVKTDGAGYFRLNYTVKSYDNQKVTFKFAGNTLYAASSNSTTFKVKQPTYIKHASIGNVKQGTVVLFVGRVMYNETTGVKYVPVNVAVNGKVYTLKADGAGYFRLNYTTTTVGTVIFTSKFDGNSLYLASSNSSKFTVVKS